MLIKRAKEKILFCSGFIVIIHISKKEEDDIITKEEEIIIITRTKEKEAEIKRKKIRKKMGK